MPTFTSIPAAALATQRFIRARPLSLLAFILLIHTVCFVNAAEHKRLWYDEIFTLYLARLEGWQAIIAALTAGVDLNPPLPYYLGHLALALPAPPEIALRLPQFLGVTVFLVCLYRFAAARLPAESALLAPLIPLLSSTWLASVEARPYGLVLGATALALCCWQRADSLLAAAGLALALAFATASHYFAVLVPLSLAIAELVHLRTTRRFRLPVWLAFALSALPLLVLIPLWPALHSYTGTFLRYANADAFRPYLQLSWMPLLLLAAILALLFRRFPAQDRASLTPPSEIAVAVALAVSPFLGLALAKLTHAGFADRYVMYASAGLGLLVAYAAAAIPRQGLAALFTLACLAYAAPFTFTAWRFLGPITRSGEWVGAQGPTVLAATRLHPGLPLIVTSNYGFLAASLYWPQPLRHQTLYVADPASRLRWLGNSTGDIALPRLATIAPLRVISLQAFLASRQPALLLHHPLDWLTPELRARHYHLEPLPSFPDLELATPPQ